MSDLVHIKTFSTRSEAELARGILEAAGISALVAVDDAGGTRPELAFTTGGAKLLVDAGRAEAAAQMLLAREPPEVAAGRAALSARLRGCMLPAILGGFLFVGGAFAVDYVSWWLGQILVAIATVLLVLALVRGARAA